MALTYINGFISTAGLITKSTDASTIDIQRGTLITNEAGKLLLRLNDGTDQVLVNAPDSLEDVVSITNNYTVVAGDNTILADATSNSIDITLPTAVGITGRRFAIKATNVDNLVTLKTTSSQTIDGITTQTFLLNQSRTVISDGANWQQVS